jgi:hypothetical protein
MQLVETDKGVMQELGLVLEETQLLVGLVEDKRILEPAPMEAILQGMVEMGRREGLLVIPVMAKLEGMPRTVELLAEMVKLVETLPMVGTVRMVVMLRLVGRVAGMVKRAVMLRTEATTAETEVTMVEITATAATTATVATTAVTAMVVMAATTQATPTIPQTMPRL